MPDRNIYLVGFMGSGKTTVGRLVAKALGWSFLDLDKIIERNEGASIALIFKNNGEAHFRKIESQTLEATTAPGPHVLALGGGAFDSAGNRRLLAERGWTVWLDVSCEEAWKRCQVETCRPLARDRDRFEELFNKRQSNYRLAAIYLDAGQDPEALCQQVVQRCKKSERE